MTKIPLFLFSPAQMVAKDAIDAAAFDQTINERQEWDDFLDNRPNPVSIDDGDEPPPSQLNSRQFKSISMRGRRRPKFSQRLRFYLGFQLPGERRSYLKSFAIQSTSSNWMTIGYTDFWFYFQNVLKLEQPNCPVFCSILAK